MILEQILVNLKAILVSISLILAGLIGAYTGGYLTSEPADVSLGAIPGNEVQGNVLIVGGLDKGYFRESFSVASSTICSFRNPFAATSTIESFSVQVTRGVLVAASASSNIFDVSTSTVDLKRTTVGASSTPALLRGLLPSNQPVTFAGRPNSATSTLVSSDGGTILPGLVSLGNGLTGATNFI